MKILLSNEKLDFEERKVILKIQSEKSFDNADKEFYTALICSLHNFIRDNFLIKPMPEEVHINEKVNLMCVREIDTKELRETVITNYKGYHSGMSHLEWLFLDDICNNTVYEIDPFDEVSRQNCDRMISLKKLSEMLDTYEKRSENMLGESFIKGYRAALNRIRKDLDLHS